MHLSSIVSILRIAALPLIIYLIQQNTYSSLLFAVLIFLLALFTDVIDDYLRKKENVPVGSFLDPFADKILVLGLLFFFVWRKEFSFFFLALLLLREFFAALLRYSATQEDIILEEEKKYAQAATVAEFVLVSWLLFQSLFVLPLLLQNLLAPLALIFAWGSLIVYAKAYLKERWNRRQAFKELKSEPLVILANKRSSGYYDIYRRRLLKVFSRRRKAQVYYLPFQKNMFKSVEKKISLPKHLIIAGGDGSFESALNYKPFRKKSLGFFPLGAGNAFYSYFYRGNRFEYLRSRFQFLEKELDMLELSWEHGKIQTTFLSLGLDAEVMQLTKRTQQAGFWDYFVAGARGAVQAKADYDFHVLVDGKKQQFENGITLTLAKIPYFGFGLRSLLGKVDPTDGKVYGSMVVNSHPKISNKLVRLWALLFANFNLLKAPFVALKGKEIFVESAEPFPLQAAGEFLGYTSWVKVKVARKQKVLMV